MALVISGAPRDGAAVRIAGAGQAHLHQHVSSIASVSELGARRAAQAAMREAGIGLDDVDYLGIYDSFSITLLVLLEEIGIAPRGGAAARAPTEEFRALAPYVIVLVDLDEGLRMMAHGAPGLSIGERVRVGFFEHGGRSLPRFAKG